MTLETRERDDTDRVEIQFTLSRRDFAAGQRSVLMRRGGIRRLALFALVTLAGVILAVLPSSKAIIGLLGILLALYAGLFTLGYAYAILFWPGRLYRARPLLRGPIRYVLDDDGVAAETSQLSSRMAWSFITHAGRDGRFYYLHFPGGCHLILRTALQGPGVDEHLAAMLKAKIGAAAGSGSASDPPPFPELG